jgi:hypothetical protein
MLERGARVRENCWYWELGKMNINLVPANGKVEAKATDMEGEAPLRI